MEIKYSKDQWNSILNEFVDKAKKKEYDRTDYDFWKAIVKTNKVEYESPMFSFFKDEKRLASTSQKDNSFGSFLYNRYERWHTEMADIESATCNCASTNTYSNSTPYGGYVDSLTYYPNSTIANITWDGSLEEIRRKINDLSNTISEDKTVEEKKDNMKGFNFDFGPCSNDQVHISMYGIAVKNAAGTYVSYNAESGEIIDVDILNFDGAKFLYKVPVAISDIKIGDVVIHNRKPMFVIKNDDAPSSFKCVDVVNGEKVDIIPTKNMFGFNFMTKVVSLFNSIGDTAPSPEAPFGNMLPFFMMNGDMDPMMMMFMMKDTKMDPMMMMLMCQKDKDMTMPLMMYMMQKK